MNSSMLGTSPPTSLSIVLYWLRSRVHAGEYLAKGKREAQRGCLAGNTGDRAYALDGGDAVPHVGALEVVERGDDPE